MEIHNLVMTLRGLRLGGMADGLEQQLVGANWRDTPFEERLEHLVTKEHELRSQRKVDRIRKTAKMRHEALPETFDYSPSRGIDPSVVKSLFRCDWIQSGKTNLLITGLTGTGKTWMACAFGHAAARLELTVGYHRVGPLLEELEFQSMMDLDSRRWKF